MAGAIAGLRVDGLPWDAAAEGLADAEEVDAAEEAEEVAAATLAGSGLGVQARAQTSATATGAIGRRLSMRRWPSCIGRSYSIQTAARRSGGASSSGAAGPGGAGASSASGPGTGGGGTGAAGQGGGIFTTSSGSGECKSSMECAAGSYCDDSGDGCFAGGPGLCNLILGCDKASPACACDGSIYESECAAHEAGLDLALKGCEVPAGGFFCNALVCLSGAQACIHGKGFVTYDKCEDFPAACDPARGGTPACSCFQQGCECVQDPDGNFVVTCTTAD
jgi:hypothetical protein